MSGENIRTLLRGYEVFNRGDTPAISELPREMALPMWNGEPLAPFLVSRAFTEDRRRWRSGWTSFGPSGWSSR
jgi:hypothetical protein